MPTATLLTANTFTIGNQKFFKEVERNVPEPLARYLDENEPKMFRVRMHKTLVEAAPPPVEADDDDAAEKARPAFSKVMKEAIIQAADFLNPDIESNFEADGRPASAALTAVLQRVVTDADRDAAFAVDPAKTTHPDAERAAQQAKKLVVRKSSDPSKEGAVAV